MELYNPDYSKVILYFYVYILSAGYSGIIFSALSPMS